MAENRRRFRNKKRDDGRQGPLPPTSVTIVRREEPRIPVVQPKILLKKEVESNTGSGSSGSNTELPISIKTIIINRSDVRTSCERGIGPAIHANTSSNSASQASICAALASTQTQIAGKEKIIGNSQESQMPSRMTRPTPLLLANGVFNANARKIFHKSNTDFAVIGVLGAQGVGKSTLMNLLASEHSSDYDYYHHLFAPDADNCTFSIRHRNKSYHHQQYQTAHLQQSSNSKQVLRPRTETLQFFITRERYVLLDTAPMLVGSTCKEADHLELQTLATTITLLSVCHILLLAIDELNLEQLRLLHAALRLRPRTRCKGYVRNYLPQVLFVRTRAKRQDYEKIHCDQLERQLTLLFEGTGLPIYRDGRDPPILNIHMLPELYSNAAVAHHPCPAELVRQFRERVFGTVRVSMCNNNDFTEMHWFDMLEETIHRCTASSQHFEQIYAESKLQHLNMFYKWRPDSNWRKDS